MRFHVVPVTLAEANAFVSEHHRHHGEVVVARFSIGLVETTNPDKFVGVAIVGNPVARMLDDGWTLEVNRVATDGTKDACSALYGACRRATFALGFRKLITYTLTTEPGASLRASGWKLIGEAGGGSWDRPSRPRIDKHPLQKKLKWEITVGESA